ncbi:MAG: arylsulfatase [Eudoraea sp.]|uniref:sulfatase family protein n=1 Tax=Eudoraea sp. TaxID=1979955 RepID=UPI0032642E0F
MKNSILVIFVSLSLCVVACTKVEKEQRQPNIIYVLADDMGYGDVSGLNPEGKIKTLYLDKMANQGMIFTDAHTSSSVCTPTRYGILTGRYNWRSKLKSGVLTGKSKALIPTSRKTVASMLENHGYETAFIGKWHLGWNWGLKSPIDSTGAGWNKEDFENIDFSRQVTNNPNDLGFNYAYGHSGSLDMAPYVYVENGRVTALPDTTTVNTGKYSWWREGPTGSDFIHKDVTPNFFRRANKYVAEKAGEDAPFFLYLALPSPHTPILPTKEWQGKSGLNPYGDFVMMIDAYMGQLEKVIKEAGIEENTIVIFTSDNGCSPAAKIDEMEEKGHKPSYIYRGHKADIYEGGHRVPFIVKWPAKIEATSMSNQTICTTDLMATLADIIGYSLKDNEGEDSYSMLSLFEQNSTNKSDRKAIVHHSINGNFAIRKEKWKLIMAPGSGGWSFPNPDNDKEILVTMPPVQLYDLETDPGEKYNLQAKNPEIVAELKTLLIKYILDGRSTPGKPQQNDSIDFEWKQIEFIKAVSHSD